MLKLVVFLGGAALMGLEMVGSRVLAPHFGSSIFVWGSLISIFLTALSVGYAWGGGLADRRPSLSTLGTLLILPGLWVGLLPFVAPAVNAWVVSLELGARFSPLIASLILFAVPSIFLGTISPYAVRLEVQSVESAGNTAGRLYALSTGGSIVGTLVTSFVLIPAMGVRNILHTLGLLLLVLALGALVAARSSQDRDTGAPGEGGRAGDGRGGRSPGAFPGVHAGRRASKRRGRSLRDAARAETLAGKRSKRLALFRYARLAIVILGIVVVGLGPRFHSLSAEIVYQKESLYHNIIVDDHGPIRHLHFDNSFQSAINLEDPYEQVFMYTRYLHLARVFHPSAEKAFFMGLGGGSAPARFLRDYPELSIDVAEIDPEVVRIAFTYFNLPEDEPRLRVTAEDGRLFLRKSDAVYDLMVLDAYFGESIPFHLTTKEFFEELRTRLADDGVVVANVIGAIAGPQSRLLHSMVKTYQSVFPQVYVFPVGALFGPLDPLVRNIIVVATAYPKRLNKEELRRRAEAFVAGAPDRIDIRPYVESLVDLTPRADVPVLTDDYAPVDSLQHVW